MKFFKYHESVGMVLSVYWPRLVKTTTIGCTAIKFGPGIMTLVISWISFLISLIMSMNIFPLSSDGSQQSHQPPPSPAPGPHGGLISLLLLRADSLTGTHILPGEKVSTKDLVTTLITPLLLHQMIIFTSYYCLS